MMLLKDTDTNVRVDLRKRKTLKDELQFSSYDIQACMVMLVVITVLLFSVVSVCVAQNPNFII